MTIDIHDSDRQYQRSIKQVQEAKISKKNKKLIMDFQEEGTIEGLKKIRLIKYMQHLRQMAGWLNKDFDKANKNDIKKVIKVIQERDYSEWTRHDFKVILKKFYKWLRNCSEGYPPEVNWVKGTLRKDKLKPLSRDDLLTEEEAYKLIDATENIRDRAFLTMLKESGGRVGEILGLTIGDVKDTQEGLILSVKGKTGYREIPYLQESIQPFRTWLQCHPNKHDNKTALWINIGTVRKHQPMKYSSARSMIERLMKRTGMTKKVNPHLWRKSRATFLSSKGFSESLLNQYFGWREGSGTSAHYVKLCSSDLKDAMAGIHGKEVIDTKPKNKACFNCNEVNPIDAVYCKKCSANLNKDISAIKDRSDWHDFQKFMMQNPDMVNKMVEFMHIMKTQKAT